MQSSSLPSLAPSEVFISTCCFGECLPCLPTAGQNTWGKLVKEDGAYFVSQLESAALVAGKWGWASV